MTGKHGKAPPPPPRGEAVTLRTARGRSPASQRWLKRQLNDPYVLAARQQGWRSRAAFKLIELDDKFHLLRPGQRVIDLGAAPGGWTQVAVARGAAQVAGVDLLPVDEVPGATILLGDFTDATTEDALLRLLSGRPDLVLSDMAPNTTDTPQLTIYASWHSPNWPWISPCACWPRAAVSSPKCSRVARNARC